MAQINDPLAGQWTAIATAMDPTTALNFNVQIFWRTATANASEPAPNTAPG